MEQAMTKHKNIPFHIETKRKDGFFNMRYKVNISLNLYKPHHYEQEMRVNFVEHALIFECF